METRLRFLLQFVSGNAPPVRTLLMRAEHWLIKEKGAVAAAGVLGDAPPAFADRAHAILGELGTTTECLTRALGYAAGLIAEIRRSV
jgi:hypothetical protein